MNIDSASASPCQVELVSRLRRSTHSLYHIMLACLLLLERPFAILACHYTHNAEFIVLFTRIHYLVITCIFVGIGFLGGCSMY